MISHDNIIYESCVVIELMKQYASLGTEPERVLSYLPLSHVAGMMIDMICPIAIAASFGQPCTVHFARPYDLKRGTIKNRLCSVKPTMFLGVPRVWEKIAEKLKKIVRAQPAPGCIKKNLVSWGKGAGLAYQRSHQLGGSGSTPSCYCLAQRTVQKKVKAGLGLECCKFGFTGAAPISKDTLEFFGALGLQINEVYGMSECCGATTWSVDQAHVWGSCGWAMPGTEVKVFKPGTKVQVPAAKDIFKATDAEQGEICFRGRHIMTGYMANPDLGADHVKTIKGKLSKAVDLDGWLHSGDKGCIGTNGMVKITGRYKELIIGAGGENVAPVPIENMVKKLCPAIANCMMIGEKMPFMAAFITLKAKGATGNEPGTDDLDDEALGVVKRVTTISAASQNDEFKNYLLGKVSAANKAAAPSNAACIRKICILPRDFSVATGELTPTLKLKRSVVMKMNKDALDAVYAAAKNVSVVPYVGNVTAVASKNATAAEPGEETEEEDRPLLRRRHTGSGMKKY
jgi:long-chain-fatty-acid--CoA ligase ACSBG